MAVYRQELSPTFFLERAGEAYAQHPAVVDGNQQWTWQQFRSRARRFASALIDDGLSHGDRIAFLALNSEPMLLAHFAVPQAGGVLVSINTRLTARDVAYIIENSEAKKIFYSQELESLLSELPAVIQTDDRRQICLETDFDDFLKGDGENGGGENGGGEAQVEPRVLKEDDLISINYTSGTTGLPKGVMYHHRGAYLNALAMALDHRLTRDSVFLWTLPMFHCNGWTFPWALAAVGAKSICLPRIDPAAIWRWFEDGVTHFCAAPTVLTMLINDPAAHRLERPVRIFTAGAPPSPTLIAQMKSLNFELDHVYGLTETYGPCSINISSLPSDTPVEQQASYQARQGFPNPCAGEMRVVDDAMNDVPFDGETLGEVVMRGNVVMKGYFGEPDATSQAFAGGWFHSGDLAVRHPDGSVELRDRKKDIIISGGENISTIEVEQAIVRHPAVLECAVIAIPHEKWGEVPKAFVTLKPDAESNETEMIDHCRTLLAHFKAPKSVEFGPLPKTSTGKIQKYVLREREWKDHDRRIN